MLREVVKHPTVESVVQCEIDEVRWGSQLPGSAPGLRSDGRAAQQKPALLHSIHGSCCFTCCPLSAASAFAAGSAGMTLTAPPLCLTSHLRGSWLPLSCDFFHTRTVEALPGQRGPSVGSGEGEFWLAEGAAFPSSPLQNRLPLLPEEDGHLVKQSPVTESRK